METKGNQISRAAEPPMQSGDVCPASVVITTCTDAALIAALHRATIIVAYRGYFQGSPPPTVAELVASWDSRLADPTAVALLATRDWQPVGSVLGRADPVFGDGQIVGLHVLPSEWGQGIGSDLHDAALALLQEVGHRTAGLWVIAANRRARGMYENRGWELLPGVEQEVHGVIEVRYRRDLSLPIRWRAAGRSSTALRSATPARFAAAEAR